MQDMPFDGTPLPPEPPENGQKLNPVEPAPHEGQDLPPGEDANGPVEANGRGRRIIAGLLLLIFVAGGGYYGYRMGFYKTTPGLDEAEPLEKPVALPELPADVQDMAPEEQFAKAGTSENELAYAIYQHLIDTAPSADHKSKAQFFQAVLLSQYLGKPQRAKAKFKLLIKRYPQSDYVDDAYYNLGLIYLEQNRLKEAVHNFTHLINNYPQSNQIENAKFMASKCSAMLKEMSRKQKEEAFDLLAFIKQLAPKSLLSLIAFVCAIGSPLVWIMMRLHDNEGHLVLFTAYPDSPHMRRHKLIQWIMVITFFSFISTTFFINQHQKQQEFKQLINMLQTSGINTR